MIFLQEDQEKLQKLHVKNLFDLALIVPASYDNLFISNIPKAGINTVVDAEISAVDFQGKYLKLHLFAHNFNQSMDAIIFNPKYYHQKSFKAGERVYLKGKLEFQLGKFQLLQPQIVSQINKLVPKYKTSLQNRTVLNLVKKYLVPGSLESEGLPQNIAEKIYEIHFPAVSFVEQVERHGIPQKNIDALKYVEIYSHIKLLISKKTVVPSQQKLQGDVTSFIDALPFTLTNDQKKVITEIQKDLNSDVAAKRVIMGDVGCGKTMVILASVMIAYPSRTILMAPTTILAAQIYEEAEKFLPHCIKVGFVSGSTKVQNLEVYDFIIGTHALLYRELPKSDLIMIDEQHRFGTKQREMIKHLVSEGEKRPHFLQFSATPIPRTLSMIQSSLIDISYIKELPFKKDIDTKIITKYDFKDLIAHIKEEIQKGRQTIIVYPLVEESEVLDYQSIDQAKHYWQENFENVYITYGKDKEKEEVLEAFREQGNILLATTVIEVGISLPKLSTIVIVAPERLGLATLHQLRGRVSRNGLKGYCYLFTKQKSTKRLKEFTDTLNGFEIAELDLKYRQAGDLLKGYEQSGKSFKWFDAATDETILSSVKENLGLKESQSIFQV